KLKSTLAEFQASIKILENTISHTQGMLLSKFTTIGSKVETSIKTNDNRFQAVDQRINETIQLIDKDRSSVHTLQTRIQTFSDKTTEQINTLESRFQLLNDQLKQTKTMVNELESKQIAFFQKQHETYRFELRTIGNKLDTVEKSFKNAHEISMNTIESVKHSLLDRIQMFSDKTVEQINTLEYRFQFLNDQLKQIKIMLNQLESKQIAFQNQHKTYHFELRTIENELNTMEKSFKKTHEISMNKIEIVENTLLDRIQRQGFIIDSLRVCLQKTDNDFSNRISLVEKQTNQLQMKMIEIQTQQEVMENNFQLRMRNTEFDVNQLQEKLEKSEVDKYKTKSAVEELSNKLQYAIFAITAIVAIVILLFVLTVVH
ncbi:unnamed protein product, partial [Didymodactylos carnosus]